MNHSAVRALCLLSVTALLLGRPAESRATLLRGEVTGIITDAGLSSVPAGQPVPFGLDADSSLNVGLPVALHFSIDTDLLPPVQHTSSSTLEAFYYEEFYPTANWLTAEIEVKGVVQPITSNALTFLQARAPGDFGDVMHMTMAFYDQNGDATGQGLDLALRGSDFGFGAPPWTDVDITLDPHWNSPLGYSESHFGPGVNDYSLFTLHAQAVSLSLHPVPEPGGVTLIALAALAVVRRRSSAP